MFGASWKTSLLGICTILGAVASAAVAYFDGNPNTNPDWPTVGAAITAGWGLMHAKDANVTGGSVQNDK